MSAVHDARTALLATLLSDTDLLLRRIEALPTALTLAGDKLAADVRDAVAAQQAAADHARACVAEAIAREFNESARLARAEVERHHEEVLRRHEQAVREAIRRALAEAGIHSATTDIAAVPAPDRRPLPSPALLCLAAVTGALAAFLLTLWMLPELMPVLMRH